MSRTEEGQFNQRCVPVPIQTNFLKWRVLGWIIRSLQGVGRRGRAVYRDGSERQEERGPSGGGGDPGL